MTVDAIAPWAETALITADQLLALADDSSRYELVEGRLVRMPPTGLEHGYLEAGIVVAIRRFVNDAHLGLVVVGETGFLLSRPGEPDTLLAPDIAFIQRDRVPLPDSPEWKGFPRLCPDLVVEIGSPRQGRSELGAKARLWLAHGTRLVWVVWPQKREVDVWRPGEASEPEALTAAGVLDGHDILPGFSLPLAELFA